MIKINKNETEMIGQMFNYLHNAIVNEILSGNDINNLLNLNEDSLGNIELKTEQIETIKKITDYFIENSDKAEFSTLTGYEYSDLLNLSSKIKLINI